MVDRNKLDELYEKMVDQTFALLEKNGEFFPIGAVVKLDGETRDVITYDGREQPESQTVIDELTQVFQEQALAGEIIASAIAFDARIRSSETGKAVDTIITRIRATGYARDVAMPYLLKTSGIFKKTYAIEGGQASASAGEQDIFT